MHVSRHAWLWASLLFSGAASAQVDISIGGAPKDLGADFTARYGLGAGPVQFVGDPKNSGRTVMLSRVNYAEAPTIPRNDVYARNESTGNTADRLAVSRWYALSVYFPSSWKMANTKPTVVAQIDTVRNVSSLAPPVAILTRGNKLELQLNFNHRELDGATPARPANSSSETIVLDRVRPAQWYCFVLRATWSPVPGDGALRLWMNGYQDKNLVYEAVNASNAYETEVGYLPRVGLVHPEGTGVVESSLYADFIWLGSGANTSAEMMFKKTPCFVPTVATIAAGSGPVTAGANSH